MTATALTSDADVVVIGGGIMGLSTAWNLARLGKQRVVVVERSYLCSGASGRNGGGVRAQWSDVTNIRLMKESIALCRAFATKMRFNVWFRQGGYLFLARSDVRATELEASVALQRECGLPTRMLDAAAARKLVPELNTSGIVAASYNPDDGVVFPWPFVWGYANACERLGVAIHTFTDVVGVDTEAGRIAGVVTSKGRVRTPLLVLAAGAWSPNVARMVGVELPSYPHRHEICSTEPLKPFLRPLVADLATGLYVSQSMRGELVGGISNDQVPRALDQSSSLRFLGLYSRELVRTMPILGAARVLRQWAGCYDMTSDGAPLVGRVDEIEGLLLVSGFAGHGFMMAPIMGKLVAEHIASGRTHEVFEKWSLRRFKEGKLLQETMRLG